MKFNSSTSSMETLTTSILCSQMVLNCLGNKPINRKKTIENILYLFSIKIQETFKEAKAKPTQCSEAIHKPAASVWAKSHSSYKKKQCWRWVEGEKEKLVCVLISGEVINILENDGNSWPLFCSIILLHLLLFRKVGIERLIFSYLFVLLSSGRALCFESCVKERTLCNLFMQFAGGRGL